jgi:uncharacterized Fe-S center protein
MPKPKSELTQKSIRLHPSIKDEVVDFAKARSLEVVFSEQKNIAVITPKRIQFVVYKAQYEGSNRNYIHVNTLKDLEGIEWSDVVRLVTKYEMPNAEKLETEVTKLINSKK